MLSYALSTGTHFATSYFHLPFDEEEDKDIENYERKYITWVADATPGSTDNTHPPSSSSSKAGATENASCDGRGISAETSPFSSGPSSPSSSNASLLSACSSSASISSMSSVGTSVSSGSTTTTGHSRSASDPCSISSSAPQPTIPSSSSSKSKTPSYLHARGTESSPTSRATSPTPTSPRWKPTSQRTPPTPSTASSSSSTSPPTSPHQPDDGLIRDIIRDNDLYSILGLSSKAALDKMALRRAYLARSRLCHPDKYPSNPDATQAFQKVSIAYDVLSTPSLKRRYDEHRARASTGAFMSAGAAGSSSSGGHEDYDVFASARPSGYAEDTLRSVILGVFNDFLDNGDLEVIRNLLKSINEMNPGVKIGDEGVKTVLSTLHSIRERALTCRTCIYTLHNELTRLLEVQHAFSQLSYFDILGRTRMAVQLSRIAVGLPVVLEKALLDEREEKARVMRRSGPKYKTRAGASQSFKARSWEECEEGECYVDADGRLRRKAGGSGAGEGAAGGGGEVEGIFPRHVMLIVRGVDVALERMERILKGS